MPKITSVAHRANAGVQAMGLATQRAQMPLGVGAVDRFVEQHPVAFENLIGTDDDSAGMAPADLLCLQFGQRFRNLHWRGLFGCKGALYFVLVDPGGIDFPLTSEAEIMQEAVEGDLIVGAQPESDGAHPWLYFQCPLLPFK